MSNKKRCSDMSVAEYERKKYKKWKKMKDKYGYLLHLGSKELPDKHKASVGGLRCFGRVYKKKPDGNKDYDQPSRRCKQSTAKGSFYCRKHKGGNSNALKTGSHQTARELAMRGIFKGNIQDLLTAFINDPKIKDLRPELAALRVVLNQYIQRLTSAKPLNSYKKMLARIKRVVNSKDDTYTSKEKVQDVKKIMLNEEVLTDGKAVDRLSRVIHTISQVVERMNKVEQADEYFLTPDGLKMILRQFTELLQTHVISQEVLTRIYEGLQNVSTQTKKQLPKAKFLEAEFEVVE